MCNYLESAVPAPRTASLSRIRSILPEIFHYTSGQPQRKRSPTITLVNRSNLSEARAAFGKFGVFWNVTSTTVEQSRAFRSCSLNRTKIHRLRERQKAPPPDTHHRPRKRYGERQCLRDTGRRSATESQNQSKRQGTLAWKWR